MNVYELSNYSPSDLKSTARFLEILSSVHNRISRPNLTPADLDLSGSGLIDKLVIFLPKPMNRAELWRACEPLGYKVTEGFLEDKKYYLTIHGPQKIHCSLGVPYNQDFHKIFLNPSHVEKFSITEFLLLQIFGNDILNANNYRMDFTVDIYEEEFETILAGLDIKNKKANSEYANGSMRSGLLIGSGNDKVNAYNKAKKEKEKAPRTRIERQMSGNKILVKKFGDLKNEISRIIEFDPFETIQLNKIIFNDENANTDVQQKRLNELKTLIKYEGLFLTRKKLNTSNHFDRDYKALFTAIPYKTQPSEIFRRDIINFFKEEIQ